MKKKTIKTTEDAAIFVDALNNPPEPNEALKQAQKRYKGLSIKRVDLLKNHKNLSDSYWFDCFIDNVKCKECMFHKSGVDRRCPMTYYAYEYQPLIDFLTSSKKVNITLKDIEPFKIKK